MVMANAVQGQCPKLDIVKIGAVVTPKVQMDSDKTVTLVSPYITYIVDFTEPSMKPANTAHYML